MSPFHQCVLCELKSCNNLFHFSSPEPLAHGGHRMSIVCRQQLTFSKRLVGLLPNLAEMILMWPSLKIVLMVSVNCIPRPNRLK